MTVCQYVFFVNHEMSLFNCLWLLDKAAMTTTLGHRLKARAKELALADAEVARRLDISQSRYAHYVTGSREPDYQTLLRICRALGVSPNVLLVFSDEADRITGEQEILRIRVLGALRVMEIANMRLAADILDLIARQRETMDPPSLT